MSRYSETYRQLWNEVTACDTYQELLHQRQVVGVNATRGDLAPHEVSLLNYSVLERVTDISISGQEEAASIIIDWFLPYCLDGVADAVTEDRLEISADRHRAQKLLKEWIQRFDDSAQLHICNTLVKHMLPLLQTPERVQVSWILAEIGFRDETLIATLLTVGEEAPTQAAPFLRSAMYCGAEPNDRVLGLVDSLWENRVTEELPAVLELIAAPNRHEILTTIITELHQQDDEHFVSYPLSILAESLNADTRNDDEAFGKAWKLIKEFKNSALMNSRILPSLDFPCVIPEILGWIASLEEIKSEGHRLWRITNRLFECFGKTQLDSWFSSLVSPSLDVVTRLAKSPSIEHDGVSASLESEINSAAVKTLLFSGSPEIVGVLTELYANSEYSMHKRAVAKLACGISLSPLPRFVVERITTERNPDKIDSLEFAKNDLALNIAQSNGSMEAFEALLNFGFTVRDGVLSTWADALCTVAYDLRRRDVPGVTEAIIRKLESTQPKRHREAAARVCWFLAARELLPPSATAGISGGVFDQELSDHARADLVCSLNVFSVEETGYDVVSKIREQMMITDQSNLRLESAVFLARHENWAQHLEHLWHVLGWERDGVIPESGAEHLEGWKCVVVAEIFRREPYTFGPQLEHVIENCDEDACLRVCHSLRSHDEIPEQIVDSLVRRLLSGAHSQHSPAYLFEVLGKVAPERLISDELWVNRDDWILGGKIGFIDALRKVEAADHAFDYDRIAKLDVLCGDSSVAVRRAAQRAIAMLSHNGDSISELFRRRADEDQPLWRHLLAAETIEFLPEDVRSEFATTDYRGLRYHQFRQVRDQVRTSLEAARKRDTAAHCREQLLTMKTGDNDEVLRLFAFGDALAELGDIEDLEIVRAFLIRQQELQINSRIWLQQIIDRIAERVNTANHDITLAWNAIYETFSGTLSTEAGDLEARFDLWRQPGVVHQQRSSWGGTAVLGQELSIDAVMRVVKGTVRSKGRAKGEVVVGRIKGTVVNVRGSGKYPSHCDDGD